MNESKHPIDDLFKQAAADYSVKPSAYSWDRLEKGLQSKHPVDDVFKEAAAAYAVNTPAHTWDRIEDGLIAANRAKRMVWMRWAAAIVAIISSFGLGYYLANQNSNPGLIATDDQTQINQTIQVSKKNNPSNETDNQLFTETNPTINSKEKQNNSIKNKESDQQKEKQYPLVKEENILFASMQPVGMKSIASLLARISNSPYTIDGKIVKEDPAYAIYIKPYTTLSEIQDEGPEYVYDGTEENIQKWSFGGAASPLYAYRATQTDNLEEAPMLAFAEKHVDQTESPIISYSGGLGAHYKISKRFALSSGLYYSKYGQKSNNFIISNYSPKDVLVNTSAGEVRLESENEPGGKFMEASSNTESTLTQQFNYLEIPLNLTFRLFQFKKANIHLMGGVQSGYMVSNSARVNLNTDELLYSGETQNLNKYSIGSNMGLGFEYKIAPHVSFSLVPNVNIGMKNINKQSGINHFPFALKIFSGINFYID